VDPVRRQKCGKPKKRGDSTSVETALPHSASSVDTARGCNIDARLLIDFSMRICELKLAFQSCVNFIAGNGTLFLLNVMIAAAGTSSQAEQFFVCTPAEVMIGQVIQLISSKLTRRAECAGAGL
jgi:hypothetical protein